LVGCELGWVACWLLPALKRSHDLYARYVCCIVARLSDSHLLCGRGGSGARCPLPKHSPPVATAWGGSYCCDTACSGLLFTERCHRLTGPEISPCHLCPPARLPEFLVQPCMAWHGMARPLIRSPAVLLRARSMLRVVALRCSCGGQGTHLAELRDSSRFTLRYTICVTKQKTKGTPGNACFYQHVYSTVGIERWWQGRTVVLCLPRYVRQS
jgi:hypothetical protein